MTQKLQTNPGEPQIRSRHTTVLDHMRQLFQDDPDPLFLEESWAFGVAAATQRLHNRRQQQSQFRNPIQREFDSMAAVNFVPAEPRAQSAAAIRYQPEWLQRTTQPTFDSEDPQQSSTAAAWSPTDWVPEDQIAQRTLPHGWTPATPPQSSTGEDPAAPMTLAHARQLLGVPPTASRDEIRSAFRRIVSQCHPDLYAGAPEAVHQRVTRQMTELNQAYSLLRTQPLQQAA